MNTLILEESKGDGMNDDEMLFLQQSRENETTERDGNDVDALSVSTSSISSTANRSFSCSSSSDSAESITTYSNSPTLDVSTSKSYKHIASEHSHVHHSTRVLRRAQQMKRDDNPINKRRQGRLSDTGILGHLGRLSLNESTATDYSEINATTLLQDSTEASKSDEDAALEEDFNEEEFDYDLKIVLTRNTVSDDDSDQEYMPSPYEDDTTVTLVDENEENYSSSDDSDDTITEVESHNQSIDDHLSTETEEDIHAEVIERTSNSFDCRTTTSSSSGIRGDQESNFESHCINLVKEMDHVAYINHDERVGPPTTPSSSPSSKQSSSCNYLSTNHSDLTLPDLNHNYSSNTLLGKLSCSEDESGKIQGTVEEFDWINNTFDGYSFSSNNENNNLSFDDPFSSEQMYNEIIVHGTSDIDRCNCTAEESNVNIVEKTDEKTFSDVTRRSIDSCSKKKGNNEEMLYDCRHPTSVSVASKGQESEPSNFSSSTEGSTNNRIIPGNTTKPPPPTSFSSSSTDESKGIINLASSSTQTSPFYSLDHPQETKDFPSLSPNSNLCIEGGCGASKIATTTPYNFEPTFKWKINGSPIGRGSFGTVHLGIDYTTGTLMAVKSILLSSHVFDKDRNNRGDSSMLLDFQREINVLRSLNHENIVRYLGSEVLPCGEGDSVMLYIFQEWVPGGSLAGLLRKFGPFSTTIIQRYLMQILQGLSYLHEHHIIHRDIKGGNILVDDRGVVKLADFGAAKQGIPTLSSSKCSIIPDQQKAFNYNEMTSPGSAYSYETEDSQDMEHTLRGTPYFMAPEVYGEKYGRKCDIWSVGCTVYQMLTASPPWKSLGHKNPIALLLHLKSTVGCPPPFEKDTANDRSGQKLCHTEIQQIMELCFQRNPKDRPSARRLLRRAFFTKSYQEDNARLNGTTASADKALHDQKLAIASSSSPPLPSNDQSVKVTSREDERSHAALSPQIFTDQASQGTKNKSERHIRIDSNSLVSRGMERNIQSDTISSVKESRAPVFPSNVGNVGRRLPPPNSQAKPSSNKLGMRPNEARNIPPLSSNSRRSTTKTVVQHDSSTIGSTFSPSPDEPIVYFDLTYSNSNESEDLPVSINPLGAEVTSPLSNCSSNGENSLSQSISSQPLLSDNWPTWAKERAIELEDLHIRGNLAVKERKQKDAASHQSSKKIDRTSKKDRTFGRDYGSLTSKSDVRSTGMIANFTAVSTVVPNDSSDILEKSGLSKQKKERKANPFARRKSGVGKKP